MANGDKEIVVGSLKSCLFRFESSLSELQDAIQEIQQKVALLFEIRIFLLFEVLI